MQKLHQSVMQPPLMMAQSRAESTWEIVAFWLVNACNIK